MNTNEVVSQVLICCDPIDCKSVEPFMVQLNSVGVSTHAVVGDGAGGTDGNLELHKYLRRARLVLVFLSKDSVRREGPLQRAILAAIDRNMEKPPGRVFIVPVRLDDCETHARLAALQRVDVFERDGWANLFRQVFRRCTKGSKPLAQKDHQSAARSMRGPSIAADAATPDSDATDIAATGEVPLLTFPHEVKDFVQHCISRPTWKRIDLETRRFIATLGCKLESIFQIAPRTGTTLVVGFECLALGAMGENFAAIVKRCVGLDPGLLGILLAVAAARSISYMRLDAIKSGNDGVNNLFFTINLDPLMADHPHFETFLNWHRYDLGHNVIFEINESTTARSLERLKMLQVEFDLRYAADDINAWDPQVRDALLHRVEMTKVDYSEVAKAMKSRGDDPFETIYLLRKHKIEGKPLVLEGVDMKHVRFLERYWDFPRQGSLYGQGQDIECGPPWEEAVSPLKPYGGAGGGFIRRKNVVLDDDDSE